MPVNFLEELAAEWYEFRGYFVRRNIQVGPRPRGGYECELDVVAFHPESKQLVQIESSMGAESWEVREKRFGKKFEAGRRHIPHLFQGLHLPMKPEQLALLVFASTKNRQTVGGGKIFLIADFLQEIFTELRSRHIAKAAVSEHLPILRSLQFVSTYRKDVWKALNDGT